MMRLQLMLMSAKLKIVRLQFRNGAIWALIALFLANQIAPIVHDFKMNIINSLSSRSVLIVGSFRFVYIRQRSEVRDLSNVKPNILTKATQLKFIG